MDRTATGNAPVATGASRPTRALVVDDERMNREVIVANLRAGGYHTVTAEDGVQAWEILDRMPEDFDVILLDRRMPRMDGMELLLKLKADERLRGIPVIMQTALSSTEDVAEGIAAGVYYYLPKPLDRRVLMSVVAAAVDDHQRVRRLRDDLEKRTSAINFLESGVFRFRTMDEGNRLAVALARACPRSQFLVVGLSEMLSNAVEHGNLGITYDEKARLIADKRLTKEIEARLDAPHYRNRWVTVTFERLPGEARITIRDEGQGFDWRKYVELEVSRAFAAHGRGIAMAKRLAFDSVEYRDPGNEVMCVVRGEAELRPCAPAAVPEVQPLKAPMDVQSSLEEDVKLARSMQSGLLPTPQLIEQVSARYGVKVSGFFETSCELGGDIWGLEPVDESRFAVWLADFSGHGVTAAMNTFRLHTLMSQIAANRAQPAEVLGELNARLAGLLPLGHYATMLYGVVDVEAGAFVYSGAAAPAPLSVDLAQAAPVAGDGAGLPLGVHRAARYRERHLPLPSGGALFMASDALAESKADDGSTLGAAGVANLVGQGVAAHRTQADVHAILAPFLATVARPLGDDLTAICCLRG